MDLPRPPIAHRVGASHGTDAMITVDLRAEEPTVTVSVG